MLEHAPIPMLIHSGDFELSPLKVYSFLLDDTTIADDTQNPVNTQVRNGTEEVGRDGCVESREWERSDPLFLRGLQQQ